MRPPASSQRTTRESGSVMLLALFLIVCVGIIASVAITYAGTSLTATNNGYIPARAKQADAEAAIRTALQYAKVTQLAGGGPGEDIGAACPMTYSYPGLSGTVSVKLCPLFSNPAVNESAERLTRHTMRGPAFVADSGGALTASS